MGNGKSKTIYVQCSPNLGILDNWLPILHQIKKSYPSTVFKCVIPKSGTVDNINVSDALINISEKIFSSIIFRTNRQGWAETTSFREAKEYCNKGLFYYPLFKIWHKIGRILNSSLYFSKLWMIWERWLFKKIPGETDKIRLDDRMIFFYDVSEEVKPYCRDILYQIGKVPKFSLCHGINIHIENDYTVTDFEKKRGEVTSFLFSTKEVEYYEKAFLQCREDLKVIGIPRHNSDWLSVVKSESAPDYLFKEFVFIVSRPAADYFPLDRKERVIREIQKVIIEENGLPVVVRLHPKEREEGIYERVFGKDNKGKTWEYSITHPLVIGQNCKFAISFYSGIAVDLAFLNRNTIEYLDMVGLEKYDHQFANRDERGRPILSYRYFNLVHGVNTLQELRDKVAAILEDPQRSIQPIRDVYNLLFFKEDSIKRAMSFIAEKLDD